MVILVILFRFPVVIPSGGFRFIAVGVWGEGGCGCRVPAGVQCLLLKARQREGVPGLPQAHFLQEGFVTASTACSVALCTFFCQKSDARTVPPPKKIYKYSRSGGSHLRLALNSQGTSKAFSPMSQKGDLSLGKGNWGRVGTPQGWGRAARGAAEPC